MLPERTLLGELLIFEIYEYFDGPKLFAAKDNVGTRYLVYWFDETESATGWLYLPISEARLSALRRKNLSLNEAYRQPERNYYLVYTSHSHQNDSAVPIESAEINAEFLPPEGHFIEYVDVVDDEYPWIFETNLKGKIPTAEAVTQFIGRFHEVVESVMQRISGRVLLLYPRSALEGSLMIKFGADDDEVAFSSLRTVEELITTSSEQDLRDKLLEHKIDASQFKDFLSSIRTHKIDLEIVPKVASAGESISFPLDLVVRCIDFLTRINMEIVDSIKIPQADDLDKVLVLVRLIHDGQPLLPENIGDLTTPRQVQYYRDAAYALGLITRDLQLTAAGEFVHAQLNPTRQYEVLADRFESIDFGWAWLRWAGKQYMTELDPSTAEQFLLDSVPTLSPNTAQRRARTLKRWLTKLQPFHRRFQQKEG